MHYVNTTFDFLGGILQKRESILLLNHHFLCIKMKFYLFIAGFLYLKDKKLKKSAVALKFPYFYIYMTINLHFTSHKNIDKKNTQTKLHNRQIPIYREVPGSIK